MRNALGIVGGLGPVASADFLLSIYELNPWEIEQQAPAIVLYSDPGFPDRTAEFIAGREDLLLRLLEEAVDRLRGCDVSRIVIACITIHHLLPRVAPHLREMTISLIDVALDAVIVRQQPALLLATKGTLQMRVFESSELWPEASRYIVMPNHDDQEIIHGWIYKMLKMNLQPSRMVPFIKRLCQKYGVAQWIAGCTELHRVCRYLLTDQEVSSAAQVVDPLLLIAQNYKEFVHEQAQPHGRLCGDLHPLCR